MSSGLFNIAKGSFVEKFRDGAANGIVLLLKVAEADDTLNNHATLAALLAGSNTEANFTNYARKTGLTGTITVDNTTNIASVSIPNQTWTAAGGGTNNTLVKAIVAYQESAADSGRIPLAHFDWAVTTDGSDLVLQFNTAGFAKAA